MPEPTPAEEKERWGSIGGQVAGGAIDYALKLSWVKWITANLADLLTLVVSIVFKLAAPLGTSFAKTIAAAEDVIAPEVANMAAAAVSDAFGTDIPASTFATHRNRSGRNQASDALGAGIVNTFKGAGGPIEPGDAAAKRYLTMVINMGLEGWYQGFLFEFITSMFPKLEIGQIESFAELDDTIARQLGLGRITRSVLRPIIDATVVTPFKWQTNKIYGPELLGVGDAVKAFNQGAFSKEELAEELGRLGFNARRAQLRIDLETTKLSAGDIRAAIELGYLQTATAESYLRNLGFDETRARQQLEIWQLQRQYDRSGAIASKATAAYVDRDITRGELAQILESQIPNDELRTEALTYAELSRTLTVKHLSLGQVEAMVKSKVANIRDYRDAAIREGYDDDAVTLLELQLRAELDKQKTIDEHRAELEAARAAAAAERATQLATRKAAIDAERALARRGSEADLERAVVRGLIPIARLEEVYRARYDDDTVGILVGEVEADRLAYLAQQAARDEAEKRGTRRNLDAGGATAAFMAGLLTRDELRARLQAIGFDAGDAELLTATAAARKADVDAAKAKRAQAETAAATRSIDLGRFEQLVRKGVRTFADYAALLRSLSFDEAAVAAMVELLELHVADDAAARQARLEAEPRLQARGLSLEQIRRAVILGIATEDDYGRFLVEQRFTADAQTLLLEELRADVAEADAARRRRETPAPVPQAPAIPLSTVRRAAQLGLIAPDAYIARLEAAGYSDDDIAIELALLIKEMADVQADRARGDTFPDPTPARRLSLADVERAVKAGTATVDDYVAQAVTLGYSADDAQILGTVLERERATLAAARKRRDELAFSLAAGGASLGALEAQVKAGELDVVDYGAQLRAWGSDDAEAELLTALLVFTLDKPPDTA